MVRDCTVLRGIGYLFYEVQKFEQGILTQEPTKEPAAGWRNGERRRTLLYQPWRLQLASGMVVSFTFPELLMRSNKTRSGGINHVGYCTNSGIDPPPPAVFAS